MTQTQATNLQEHGYCSWLQAIKHVAAGCADLEALNK
jgi:hypothetical protein